MAVSEWFGGLTFDGILWLNVIVTHPLRAREDAVMVRIALTGATRKILSQRLQCAYATHTTRLIRRIHALLGLADAKAVCEVADLLGVGEQTVRD